MSEPGSEFVGPADGGEWEQMMETDLTIAVGKSYLHELQDELERLRVVNEEIRVANLYQHEEIKRLCAEKDKWLSRSLTAYFPLKDGDEVDQVIADAARWRYVRDVLAFSWVDNHATFGWSFRSIPGKGVLADLVDRLIEEAKREGR